MTEAVAVGVDGADESMVAAEWGAREAEARSATLFLVCAAGHRFESPLTPAVRQEETAAEFLATARRRVAAILPDLPVTEKIVSEPPAKALIDAADEAAVLVLGSRGLGSLAGFVVGSASLSVIAHAQTPVVTVRGQPSGGNTVAVGIDFRQDCEPLLKFAFALAARRGWAVRTVHTWSLTQMYGYPSALPDTRSIMDADAEASKRSHDILAPWRTRYPEVRAEISTGSMAIIPHLLKAGTDAAVIVVGRRVRGLPFPTRIGPVTHGMLHHAACPVAVVPHE
jgi:nucleotide-binding universal stress UspA family protein